MSQYFENDLKLKDKPETIQFELMNRNYVLQSNTGVFSKDKLDMGTRILLETVLKEEKKPNRVLDLGCGIGPVGVVLYQNWKSDIVMIDVNEKAISLSKENIERNHCKATVKCQNGLVEEDGLFDCIVFNPPIRTGKTIMYSLFDQCIEHLNGNLYIVIRKQHGAQSAMNHFVEKGCNVQRIAREKGYWVLKICCQ